MKKRDLNILLAFVGIIILVAAYYLVYSKDKDKEARLTTEVNELQSRYDDLKAKEAHRDEYVAETARLKQEFDEELSNYPADLNQESTIIFLKGTEEKYDTFKNISASLPLETPFYVLGQGAGTSESLTADESDEQYVCTTAAYSISYNGSYEQLKEYLDYIATYKYRMNISNISMAYDQENDLVSGGLTLNGYAVNGPDRVPDEPSVNQKEGVDNIFIGGEGSPTSSDSSAYSADNGEAIVSAHNLVILLNNAANDTSSGVIVAASESDENTYVTYEDNSVTDLNIEVYSTGDKNFVKYEIAGKSYETEILTSDITIYVKSSERVDANDKNGIDVKLSNTSVLPVYIKVVDDDNSSPRFSLAEKSGTVKVY